jgi:periplasmic protein TonB
MSYLINNQQKLNDIVFANRNKNYGAYAIRSSYGFTVLKSLGLMLLGFSSVISVLWYLSNTNIIPDLLPPEQIWDTTIYSVVPPPEPEEPSKDCQGPPLKSTIALESGSITVVDSLPPEPPVTETIAATNASASTTGTTGTINEPGTGSAGGTVTNSTIVSGTLSSEPKGYHEVDSLPEFEGGLGALKIFIRNNLRYPEPARELGEQGIVYVKFVIDEKGFVGNIKVEKRIGYGMDEEAIRVVSLIPKFKKPAKAGGHAVKIYYHVPINFVMKN